MNIKNKNSSKRKDSHSRQHTSNLRSTSKSNEKSKPRSDSKLLLRLKQQDLSQLNSTEQPSRLPHNNQIFNRIQQKRLVSGKPIDTSNQYYNHYRLKSKSKGKLNSTEEENAKAKYLNSIYMHKETNDTLSNSHLDHSAKTFQEIQIRGRPSEKEEQPTNPHILNKIRLIQKNGAIDSNGKFVVKQSKNQHADNQRCMQSQQTISIYEDKKREKGKKKEKPRKQMIKTKSRKDDKAMEIHKISTVRSADKFMKKRNIQDINSPSILDRHPQKYYENQTGNSANSVNPFAKISNTQQSNPPILSTRTSKTILSEETQTSPPQLIAQLMEAAMQVNVDGIVKQIQQESILKIDIAKLKKAYKGELLIERTKCIDFLSKLCLSLNMRRQSHSLAIHYMDQYMMIIQKDLTAKQLKLIAMTSLLLALKVDDGIMSRKLCHQYLNHMDSILNMSNKGSIKSKSIQKYKQAISALSSKETSATINKSKSQSNISDLGLTKQQKKSKKQQFVHSKQMSLILSLELDMLLKFNFKLVVRSSTYWIDALTFLWDDYINQQVAWQEDLLFRNQKNKRNLSHLYQLVQKLFLDLQVYSFSKPVIVLSAMYLVIRMRLEQQKQNLSERDIYTRYATNLNKSTNIIFYDRVGANQIFGDFLSEFQMNLSEMVGCIQYVGRNLCDSLKVFNFNSRNKYINCKNYEHHLSIYETNLQIYRCQENRTE